MGFCAVPEFAVMVGAASGAILHSVHIIVVVNHFVQQSGSNPFDGAGERSGADVDFVRAADLGDPSVFPQREVTVGFRGGLDGDGGS